ncbi:MAG: glycosyltransferase family 2 protein [Bacteroidales bacterium]|nr:glycosyltransferase family 2 protein [Bacteroidales bacterium]
MISVVIPVFNRANTLMRCLQSFEQQAFRPLELILVDNNSQDNSYQLCLDFQAKYQSDNFQIKVLRETKTGACAARNAGLRAAGGDYLYFFDSDDEVYPEMFPYLDALIKAYPQKAMILMRSHLETAGKKRLHPKRCAVDAAQHLVDPLVVTHSFLLRRKSLENIPIWNEELSRWQDFDYAFKLLWLLRNEDILFADKALYLIHASEDSISGFSYSKDAEALENALASIERFIEENDADNERLRAALAFRKVSLAALLLAENTLAAQDLETWEAYAHQSIRAASKKYRPLLRLHLAYSKRGGRGFWRIFSLFI